MSNSDKIKIALIKAIETGDITTINKIKRAIYKARLQIHKTKQESKEVQETTDPKYDFITSSKDPNVNNQRNKEAINTSVKRPNFFFDDGLNKNEGEKKLYTKPLVPRARSKFNIVKALCATCSGECKIHPSQYSQLKQMEDGRFICDKCIGNKCRR